MLNPRSLNELQRSVGWGHKGILLFFAHFKQEANGQVVSVQFLFEKLF